MALLCFDTVEHSILQLTDFAHGYIKKAGRSRVVTTAQMFHSTS